MGAGLLLGLAQPPVDLARQPGGSWAPAMEHAPLSPLVFVSLSLLLSGACYLVMGHLPRSSSDLFSPLVHLCLLALPFGRGVEF